MTRVEDGEEVWGFDFPDDEHDESFLPPKDRHVETVTLLSKLRNSENYIEVQLDMSELDLTTAEIKATYDEIRNWVQENFGLHVTNLNIAKTKKK